MKYYISLVMSLSFALASFGQGETCSTAETAIINNSYNADGPSSGMGCLNCSGTAVNADWYSFMVSETGFATVTSCEDQNDPDTRFWIYSGDCSSLSLIAQGDDGCGVGTNFSSIAEFPVEPGITYFIEWDDNWDNSAFNWRLLFDTCPGISNPVMDYATINEAQLSWTSIMPTNEATVEYGEAGFALGSGTIQNSNNATVNIQGLTIDTDYQAYIFETCPDSSISNLLGPINFSTDSLPAPSNDACSGAIPISCESTSNGTTEFANISQGDTCGTLIDSPGIWYSITGDGSLFEASTCDSANFDTKISVFSGSCDSLVCVGGIDDSFPCANNTSIFSWQSVIGEEYFILVHGYDGAVGEFYLTISCISCPSPSINSISLSSSEIIIDWTPATPGTNFILEYGLEGFVPGAGTTVNGVTGIDGPPYTISGLDPITNYSIYIIQDCGVVDGLSDTSAVLNFTTQDVPPINDFCMNAISIDCDTIISGITSFASIDDSLAPDCGTVEVVAPGVWYHIVGTGGQYTASTCNIADYDTKISVYEGPCSSLNCIVANDDAVGPDGNDCAGFSSIATWNTTNGTDYYILVHGYEETSFGTFNMEVTCLEPCVPVPPNETCINAEMITLSATDSCSYVTGFNSCSSSNLNNPGCDPFGIIQDVWYSFNTGINTSVTIDINLITATNASVALYESCDSLEIDCANDLDSIGILDFSNLNENTDYLLQFWNGGSNEAGEFEICISADSVPITGVESLDIDNKISFFPNPAVEQVIVEIFDMKDINLKVYDLRGILIDERELNAQVTPIEIANWESGVYLFVFEKEGKRAHRKLIKL